MALSLLTVIVFQMNYFVLQSFDCLIDLVQSDECLNWG